MRDYRLGIVTRTDAGGLSAQGQQMIDLLNPDKVVCVDAGSAGRGPSQPPDAVLRHPDRAIQVTVGGDGLRQAVDWLRGCEAVWTPEGFPWLGMPRKASARGIALRCHANPELFLWSRSDEGVSFALPTVWEQERMGLPVVPHPTPVGDRLFDVLAEANAAKTGPVERVLHVAAPAMLDRNGTQVVLDACRAYTGAPFTLVVAGSGLTGRHAFDLPDKIGAVTVERLPELVDRHAMYDDVDLLVLPRRYGGLCLVAFEAAAAGVPVVMPDLSPQNTWSGVATFPVGSAHHVEPMRGGRFHVHEPDPDALAGMLDACTAKPSLRAVWSDRAREWAESLSWPHVRRVWETWLDPACPAVPPIRPPREPRPRAPRRVEAPRRRPRVGPPYR